MKQTKTKQHKARHEGLLDKAQLPHPGIMALPSPPSRVWL